MSRALPNRVVHSIAPGPSEGTGPRFEYSLTGPEGSWYRHAMDAAGRYDGIGRCDAQDVRSAMSGDPLRLAQEMTAAARALDDVWFELLEEARDGDCEEKRRRALVELALAVRADRRAILEEIVDACEAALTAPAAAPANGQFAERPRAIGELHLLHGTAADALEDDYPERHLGDRRPDAGNPPADFAPPAAPGEATEEWVCSAADIRQSVVPDAPGVFADEMLACAQALDEAQAALLERARADGLDTPRGYRLAMRAMHLRRARRAAIREAMAALELAGDRPTQWVGDAPHPAHREVAQPGL